MHTLGVIVYLIGVGFWIVSTSGSGKRWIKDISNWLDSRNSIPKRNHPKIHSQTSPEKMLTQQENNPLQSMENFTKETASHTEMMKKMFQGVVYVLQQTPLANRSLSIFDRELLEKFTNLTTAQIESMRRSEVVIHSEKLKRLYQNNPDLPEKTLVSIGRYLQELEELQRQEDQVQHMENQESLVVEVVRSATKLHKRKRSKQQREKWRQAVIAHEILEKAKVLER